ncbi:nose resistant to fluoxetine protein 6-like [Physella acuta]|uniref:nose resistant to fluoxetine protein 6-like n=1 Tax=Physella acuta TaxID=109671 RepID=UPI0027DC1181|nr:nose resistant to fluoxetine protein 6-like [Physella acuta]
MPDSCTEEEISRLVGAGLHVLNVTDTLSAGVTECRTDEREVTAATVTAIVLLSVIAITAICGTLYDLVHFQYPAWKLNRANIRLQEVRDRRSHVTQELQRTDNSPRREASRKRPALDYDSYDALETDSSDEETVTLVDQASKKLPEPSQAAWQKVLIAFSFYTNGSKLLNTTQPPGSLTAVHGIRFLSMSWVMLGHMYTYGVETFANTLTKFSALLSTWTADVIANSFVSVDTFFTLSGILVSYLVVKDYLATGKKVNWACFYFHRLWRLTPPYMMILVTVLGLQRFMGSGALWRTLQPPDKDKCETHWWLNLLYVNNLVRSREECFGHSWYLANDMQFYLITPAMLLPLLINRSVGVVVCVTLLFAHWTATATLSVVNEWPPVMLGLDVHILETSAHWMEHYYIVPWCRIGPYIIGIFTGYVLAVYEGKLHMNKMTVLTGWVSTVGAGLAIVYGLRGDIGGEDPSVVGVAALYNAVARSAWGVCVAWVVVACSSGHGGPVDAILSWPPLIPLSRLTYMAYLVHPCLMRVYYGNQDTPYLLNDTNLVISYLGVLVFTYLLSFVLNLVLESPMIGLEKAFIRR